MVVVVAHSTLRAFVTYQLKSILLVPFCLLVHLFHVNGFLNATSIEVAGLARAL